MKISIYRIYVNASGDALMVVTRPQTLGYSLEDWPVGLAAWFYEEPQLFATKPRAAFKSLRGAKTVALNQ